MISVYLDKQLIPRPTAKVACAAEQGFDEAWNTVDPLVVAALPNDGVGMLEFYNDSIRYWAYTVKVGTPPDSVRVVRFAHTLPPVCFIPLSFTEHIKIEHLSDLLKSEINEQCLLTSGHLMGNWLYSLVPFEPFEDPCYAGTQSKAPKDIDITLPDDYEVPAGITKTEITSKDAAQDDIDVIAKAMTSNVKNFLHQEGLNVRDFLAKALAGTNDICRGVFTFLDGFRSTSSYLYLPSVNASSYGLGGGLCGVLAHKYLEGNFLTCIDGGVAVVHEGLSARTIKMLLTTGLATTPRGVKLELRPGFSGWWRTAFSKDPELIKRIEAVPSLNTVTIRTLATMEGPAPGYTQLEPITIEPITKPASRDYGDYTVGVDVAAEKPAKYIQVTPTDLAKWTEAALSRTFKVMGVPKDLLEGQKEKDRQKKKEDFWLLAKAFPIETPPPADSWWDSLKGFRSHNLRDQTKYWDAMRLGICTSQDELEERLSFGNPDNPRDQLKEAIALAVKDGTWRFQKPKILETSRPINVEWTSPSGKHRRMLNCTIELDLSAAGVDVDVGHEVHGRCGEVKVDYQDFICGNTPAALVFFSDITYYLLEGRVRSKTYTLNKIGYTFSMTTPIGLHGDCDD